MFIASIRVAKLDDDAAREVVQNLSALRSKWRGRRIEGLVQTYMLRSNKGGAVLVSVWDSRRHMERFIQSKEGLGVSERFGRLFAEHECEFEELRPTWRALGSD